MKNEMSKRQPNRLKDFEYSTNGAYFITICTKDRKCIFGEIVGDGVLDVPKIHLSVYGNIVNQRIIEMNNIYANINIEKYAILPNHIHLLICINNSGTSRTPSPTNAVIPLFVSALKRLTNKQIGENIWQCSYHDHIIRDKNDYLNIWEYINSNALKWQDDKYYNGGGTNES